ncbi:unnamed protein product [Hyaloperonospora brassicae]|uniref:Uncharacterized protein n=1 Tax=Hyaloperonospora brassicae TaxID=162125 RepID=A0AAV0UF74_HYABA|nr:unnamed protein product [Hyaloperonospora brassicae]
MADCAAKEGSQETAVRLLGLIVGMYFANAVNASQFAVWVAFLVLTIVHVYANYNAVSCLCIPTVNLLRGLVLVERFLASGNNATGVDNGADQVKNKYLQHGILQPMMMTVSHALMLLLSFLCVCVCLLLYRAKYSIRSVNQKEPVFSNPVLPVTSQLTMGSQLHEAVSTTQDLEKLLQIYAEEKFLLNVVENHVHVVFQADAQPNDELRAFFQAVLVLQALASARAPSPSSRGGNNGHFYLLESAHHQMVADFPLFLQVLENNGWRTHMYLLNTSPWRIKIGERT